MAIKLAGMVREESCQPMGRERDRQCLTSFFLLGSGRRAVKTTTLLHQGSSISQELNSHPPYASHSPQRFCVNSRFCFLHSHFGVPGPGHLLRICSTWELAFPQHLVPKPGEESSK